MKARGAIRIAAVAAVLAGIALLAPALASAAGARAAWTHVAGEPAPTHAGHSQVVEADDMRVFTLDRGEIGTALADEGGRFALPAPGGGFARFDVAPTPVMAPKLARLHPEIATYAGTAVDDPRATVRITTSPLGLQASVRGGRLGDWYVDPIYQRDASLYGSYLGGDLVNRHGPLSEPDEIEAPAGTAALGDAQAGVSVGEQLRTYRLALLTDPSYATFFGAANVTAAKVALINRVDQIYEDELAIRMVLIGNNDEINFDTAAMMTGTNGPCGQAACYTAAQSDNCGGDTLSRTRIVIGQVIGASNFDIGHIALGLNGGGIASLGVVGGSSKAQGCTGIPVPTGDFYAVDYVAHEMGHQYSGNHTFNGNESNCGPGNREPTTSVEPGSGSSIMAYAGICDRDDLQPHSDPYFSQRSFDEMEAYVGSAQPPIDEIQSVGFRSFDGTDSFKLRYGSATSSTITNGSNYNTPGITAALGEIGIAGIPDGFGATVAPNQNGFEVEFTGGLALTNVPNMLEIVDATGFTTTGFSEIDKGGPIDNGGVTSATGNAPPAVSVATGSVTIPYRTPFALTGSATDADSDPLTYMWEQNDPGVAGTLLVDPAKTDGPLFRQFGTALDASTYNPGAYQSPGENHPNSDPTRVFPDLEQILANNTNAATGDCPNGPAPAVEPVPAGLVNCYSEFLPVSGYAGPMHFRLTARDGSVGGGGVGSADTTVNLAPGTGPFLVTAPNTAVSWPGFSSETITWDVAGTSMAPIGAANVKISLSTDGGQTFPHVLAASTPNDGSQALTVPNVATTGARLKIEGVDNVFFDVSDADFTITSTAGPAPPIVSAVSPASPANNNSPKVTGSAPSGTTVKLYDNPGCTGAELGSGSAADFASPGVSATVAGDTTTTIYANATDSVPQVSFCSSTFVTYVEDSSPPAAPAITGTDPASPSTETSPKVKGTAEAGAGTVVKLYSGPDCTGNALGQGSSAQFSSPGIAVTVPAAATTNLRATATDPAGNTSACSAAFPYTVSGPAPTPEPQGDTTAPETTITSGPKAKTKSRMAIFEFTSGESGSRFRCSLDGAPAKAPPAFGACTSPHTVHVGRGWHRFTVFATDAAGNEDATPATFRWKVLRKHRRG